MCAFRAALCGLLSMLCCFPAIAQPKQSPEDPPTPPPRPNILLIVTDDQGWWDVGVHGNKTLQTPSMDRLAKESVSFSRFYVAPVCAPTRAGLMTGRYAFRTGLYNTRFGGDTLPDEEITVAELLNAAGYRTGLFGKWHLGRYKRHSPMNQGFDQSLYFTQGHIEHYDYPDMLLSNGRPVDARGYVTELLTDAAINFMVARRRQPFFCYVAYNVPHSPFIAGNAHAQLQPGDRLIGKYLNRDVPLREARIYAMIERCDQNVGRLLDTLDRLELSDNTIVMFMSDNGGIHGHFTAGLRGRKGSVYEGGVRSPLFVRWPGHFPQGVTVDAVASHIDILPTLCDLLDLPLPEDRALDGKSIRRLLENGTGRSPHTFVYHSWNRYVPLSNRNWAIGGTRYKLANGRLFDLIEDPGETTDIAAEHPELVKAMRQRFLNWFDEVTHNKTYQPVRIEVGREDENPVELQMSWAELNGEATEYVFRGYDWDTVEGWNRYGDSAAWRIRVVRDGTYEVTVSYGASEPSAGGKFTISAQLERLEATVEPTPTRDVFVRHRIGTIDLQKGLAELAVQVEEANRPELMALNRIWLRRVKAE